MFIFDASAISAATYQADAASEVQPKPRSRSSGFAPYNPARTGSKTGTTTAKGTRAAPLPAATDPGPTRPAHPVAETNKALPPPPDKTTAPRTVDPSGNPRPPEQVDQPSTATDTPITPPPPEGRDQLDTPGKGGRGIPPAPPPRKTTKTPKNERRAPKPPLPTPPPGGDTTRSPWSGGANGVP